MHFERKQFGSPCLEKALPGKKVQLSGFYGYQNQKLISKPVSCCSKCNLVNLWVAIAGKPLTKITVGLYLTRISPTAESLNLVYWVEQRLCPQVPEWRKPPRSFFQAGLGRKFWLIVVLFHLTFHLRFINKWSFLLAKSSRSIIAPVTRAIGIA